MPSPSWGVRPRSNDSEHSRDISFHCLLLFRVPRHVKIDRLQVRSAVTFYAPRRTVTIGLSTLTEDARLAAGGTAVSMNVSGPEDAWERTVLLCTKGVFFQVLHLEGICHRAK